MTSNYIPAFIIKKNQIFKHERRKISKQLSYYEYKVQYIAVLAKCDMFV